MNRVNARRIAEYLNLRRRVEVAKEILDNGAEDPAFIKSIIWKIGFNVGLHEWLQEPVMKAIILIRIGIKIFENVFFSGSNQIHKMKSSL